MASLRRWNGRGASSARVSFNFEAVENISEQTSSLYHERCCVNDGVIRSFRDVGNIRMKEKKVLE